MTVIIMNSFFCYFIRDKQPKNEETHPYLYPKKYKKKCLKCNSEIIDLKLARIWKTNYYFCSENCWSKWCKNFNQ